MANSKEIDIIHLIHDIHTASRLKSKFTHYLSELNDEIKTCDFGSSIELIHFIKNTVNIRKKKHLSAHLEKRNFPSINWLSVFYNKEVTDRMAMISPICALYKKEESTEKFDTHFHAIRFIRECIPSTSPIKGIENNNYLSPNVDQLFGLFDHLNMSHLSIDVCKQILSYLDICTFFKCALINHCWLNLIYRNDAFNAILKQCVSGNNMQCVMVDHSSLNRMELLNQSKFFINWQLRCNSPFIDFITLQRQWFTQYIDPHSVHLVLYKTQKHESDGKWYWVPIKVKKKTEKKLFDAMNIFDVPSLTGKDVETPDNAPQYRMKITINKPFKCEFYAQPRTLKPLEWHKKYHSGVHDNNIRENV